MTYYRDDDEYDRAEESRMRAKATLAEWEASLVKIDCPHCICGKVPVHDGSPFPALALCAMCGGRGYYVTDRK